MAPRKSSETETLLDVNGPAIGEPVSKAEIEESRAETGIPRQAGYNAEEELGVLRRELAALQKTVTGMAASAKAGAVEAARQTEATVKLYPVSSLVATAAVCAAFALALAHLRAPPRSRYDRLVEEFADIAARLRGRD